MGAIVRAGFGAGVEGVVVSDREAVIRSGIEFGKNRNRCPHLRRPQRGPRVRDGVSSLVIVRTPTANLGLARLKLVGDDCKGG